MHIAVFRDLQAVVRLTFIALLWVAGGCSWSERKTHAPWNRVSPVPQSDEPSPKSQAKADTVVLEGTVIRKPWAKTMESWDAGGSHYYVLDVGGMAIPHRSAREGVILRPSEGVPFSVFDRYKSQRVAVEGRFVEGSPWTPPVGSVEQRPMPAVDPITGKVAPIRRGSGFQVLRITRLDENDE